MHNQELCLPRSLFDTDLYKVCQCFTQTCPMTIPISLSLVDYAAGSHKALPRCPCCISLHSSWWERIFHSRMLWEVQGCHTTWASLLQDMTGHRTIIWIILLRFLRAKSHGSGVTLAKENLPLLRCRLFGLLIFVSLQTRTSRSRICGTWNKSFIG